MVLNCTKDFIHLHYFALDLPLLAGTGLRRNQALSPHCSDLGLCFLSIQKC